MAKAEIEPIQLQLSGNIKDYQQERVAMKESLLQVSEGALSYWHLDFGFLPSRMWDNKYLSYEATQDVTLCYGNPGKPMQIQTTVKNLMSTGFRGKG